MAMTIEDTRNKCKEKNGELIGEFDIRFIYDRDAAIRFCGEMGEELLTSLGVSCIIPDKGYATFVIHITLLHRLWQCTATQELFIEENGILSMTSPYSIRRRFVELGMLPRIRAIPREVPLELEQPRFVSFKGMKIPITPAFKNISAYPILLKFPADVVDSLLEDLGYDYKTLVWENVQEVLIKLMELNVTPIIELNATEVYLLHGFSREYAERHFSEVIKRFRK